MKLYLFITNHRFERIPPGTVVIKCDDPRVLSIMKKRNIRGVPCLWVKGEKIDSIYYDEVIQEYFDSLVPQVDPILELMPATAPPIPAPEEESPKKPAIPFGPDFDDR